MKTQIKNKNVWLNYHHLYYFMVVASEGSIASASKKLSIGQSALSIQLKQFEDSISVKLFERSHRKLVLTENGKIALEYAHEVFKMGNEMLETLHDHPTINRVHVQVGALDTIPKHLTLQLAETIIGMKNSTVTILEGKGEELLQELIQHKIDLLITNELPASGANQVFSKKIARLPLLVLGSKKYIGLKKKFPDSLNAQPFIVPTMDNKGRHEIDHFFKLNEIKPDIIAESQDVMVQKLMALRGHGMIVIPEFAAREYIQKKELFVIGKLEGTFEELFLVAASRKIENPIATEIMKNFKIIGS
jgi:LysR family transcriptional activator of nhaA